MRVKDSDIKRVTRNSYLADSFDIKSMDPVCKDEYVRVPLDLPWKEMESDVELAYQEFGWFGMIHRSRAQWTRSELYGGLGLTHNPDYVHDIPHHAQGLGEPRSSRELTSKEWVEQTRKSQYEKQETLLNTYNDPLGLRVRNEVTRFRSFRYLFDQFRFNLFQGRIAEIRPHNIDPRQFEENKEFIWHVDENNEFVTRLLVPLVYSEDYYIEFQDTGTRIYFEPGYAYHWNTRRVHRWSYDYHEDIRNRTCVVIGIGPWITYEDGTWTANEYCNKMHPTDMIKNRIII